jgi:hypothetical protein
MTDQNLRPTRLPSFFEWPRGFSADSPDHFDGMSTTWLTDALTKLPRPPARPQRGGINMRSASTPSADGKPSAMSARGACTSGQADVIHGKSPLYIRFVADAANRDGRINEVIRS